MKRTTLLIAVFFSLLLVACGGTAAPVAQPMQMVPAQPQQTSDGQMVVPTTVPLQQGWPVPVSQEQIGELTVMWSQDPSTVMVGAGMVLAVGFANDVTVIGVADDPVVVIMAGGLALYAGYIVAQDAIPAAAELIATSVEDLRFKLAQDEFSAEVGQVLTIDASSHALDEGRDRVRSWQYLGAMLVADQATTRPPRCRDFEGKPAVFVELVDHMSVNAKTTVAVLFLLNESDPSRSTALNMYRSGLNRYQPRFGADMDWSDPRCQNAWATMIDTLRVLRDEKGFSDINLPGGGPPFAPAG